MKHLDFSNPDNRSEYDLSLIMKEALNLGYQISPQEAYEIWDEWSDMFAAGWRTIGDQEEVAQAIRRYFDNETRD